MPTPESPAELGAFEPAKRLDAEALRAMLGIEIDDAFHRSLGPIDGSEGIYEVLLSQIRSGRLNGKALSAGKLAEAFGVHRNTVAKVLSRLVDAGFLRSRTGRAPVVVGQKPKFPPDQAEFLSHEAIACGSGLVMATEPLDTNPLPLGGLDPAWHDLVRERLELTSDDQMVLRLVRIRKVRGAVTNRRWIPCIAEEAFFAAQRLPEYVAQDLQDGVVDSVALYCRSHGIKAVTSSYDVDASRLPDLFHEKWTSLATGIPKPSKAAQRAIATEPFIRFETTTHTIGGPIELSVAYLLGGVFRITAGSLEVGFRTQALADLAPERLPLHRVVGT